MTGTLCFLHVLRAALMCPLNPSLWDMTDLPRPARPSSLFKKNFLGISTDGDASQCSLGSPLPWFFKRISIIFLLIEGLKAMTGPFSVPP